MKGKIQISLQQNEDVFIFTISDTRIGLPENIDFRSTTSLGLQLVITLVDQLGEGL
jgi:two-component sensor histidine kinase